MLLLAFILAMLPIFFYQEYVSSNLWKDVRIIVVIITIFVNFILAVNFDF